MRKQPLSLFDQKNIVRKGERAAVIVLSLLSMSNPHTEKKE